MKLIEVTMQIDTEALAKLMDPIESKPLIAAFGQELEARAETFTDDIATIAERYAKRVRSLSGNVILFPGGRRSDG